MPSITPFLWFDTQAEEAMNFYLSIFPDSKAGSVRRQGPDGPVVTCSFTLQGQEFMALNAGPLFTFNEAVSFFVSCKDQEEVDYYWEKLTAGGEESQCGWLKDKYGLSWQIVPEALGEALSNPDQEKAGRAMQAMLRMKKLIVKDLLEA